jgi:hypothetical protein
MSHQTHNIFIHIYKTAALHKLCDPGGEARLNFGKWYFIGWTCRSSAEAWCCLGHMNGQTGVGVKEVVSLWVPDHDVRVGV